MEGVKTIFFDTYAFYELIAENANYKPYVKGFSIVTSRLNLMELHYGLLIKYGKEVADAYYYELLRFAVEIKDEIIVESNTFRASMKKKDLSYVDCIGYTLAKSINAKFLTGDQGFADLENVEYVK